MSVWMSPAFAASLPVDTTPTVSMLPNGMTVIVQPDHAAPVVAVQLWVHVGSKDETDETRGLAHIQEHMLFQGTKTYGPGKIFAIVQAAGGDMNAFTSNDETVYHITLPSEEAKTALEILASMMHEAMLDSTALTKELEVVMEEFRKDAQNPSRTLAEAMARTAFHSHPYQYPVIGFEDTIQHTTPEQVKDFYSRWYVPENMTLVIVGDIDVPTIHKDIQDTFGRLSARENPKRDILPEPSQTALRSVVLKESFDNTLLKIALRAPSFNDKDAPAMDALMSVLGLGRSSRLVQHLQERDHLVTGIDSAYYTLEQPYLSIINANIAAQDSARVLTGILRELQQLRTEPVTDDELSRVKAQLSATYEYRKQSYDGLANAIGFEQIVGGDLQSEERYLKALQSLTPADVQRVARMYLTPTQMTVGFLYPKDEKNTLSQSRIKAIVKRSLRVDTPRVTPSTSNLERTYDAKANVTTVHFQNGLTLLVREDRRSATFAAEALMLGGVRSETAATNGISTFTSRLLLRGTDTMNQADIASTEDAMATSIGSFSDRNTFGLSMNSLSASTEQSMELFASLLLRSTFPKDQVENVRTQLLDGIARKKDNPFLLSFQQLNATLYGSHPYGLPQDGSPEALRSLTQADLQAFARQVIVPTNMVLSVVGDVQTDTMIDLVQRLFGSMPAGSVATPVLPSLPVASSQKVATKTGDYQQTNIFLAFPTFALDHEDRYALAVADSILGSTAGRLFSVLRDQESLAYSVQGFIISGLGTPGFYGVYLGSDPEKTDAAIAGLTREMQKVADDGVSDQEVQDAIKSIAGSYVIGLQTPDAQAHIMATSERFGLGYDDYLHVVQRIRSVTREDVQRLAKKYFDLHKSTLSVIKGGE